MKLTEAQILTLTGISGKYPRITQHSEVIALPDGLVEGSSATGYKLTPAVRAALKEAQE